KGGYWSLPRVVNGILAGLVSVTAGCAVVGPGFAILIGFIGGFVYFGTSKLLDYLRIDDPLDAFPVHGMCGFWGVLATGLFATDDNLRFAGYSEEIIDDGVGKRFAVQVASSFFFFFFSFPFPSY
ncbi:MAG: ammonium transporter, partial [bacterium]|nr:ammonium transporter [bacterium]